MSFHDAYTGSEGGQRGAEECTELASSVFQITTQVTTFKKLVDLIGTSSDTPHLRKQLKEARFGIQALARDNSAGVKKLSAAAAAGKLSTSVKVSHAKIVRDFHAVIKDFQKAQRVCIEREGMYAPGEGVGTAAKMAAQAKAEAENAPLVPRAGSHMSSAQFGLLDADQSYHANLLQDRQAGINEIQAQINEVNEIFQDLAVLVNEQGEMLDDIEANITRTSVKTREAGQQLKSADESQRASRGRLIWVAFFFMCLLAILIGVFVYIHEPK